MPFTIAMPQLGLTMEKGTVVRWLVVEGQPFARGQALLEVETDKAVVPLEAPSEGTLARVLVPVGQTVPVGAALAVAVAPGEHLLPGWAPPGEERAEAPSRAPEKVAAQVPAPAREAALAPGGPLRATWKARALARRMGVDLRQVAGSGPGGRIQAEDVARAAAPAPTRAEMRATPTAARLAEALGLDLAGIAPTGADGRIVEADVLREAAALIRGRMAPPPAAPGPAGVARRVPLAGVRGITSARMAESARTTARVTLFREVDATHLVELRDLFRAQGLQVSYNDILVRVCAVALREHPEANARLGDGEVELLDRVNIGLAVDTERGLLVPVIHDADRLSIPQIAARSAALIEAARSGRSRPDDLTGGTFTITNLGMLGVEGFTPVIHLPECCILGVGRIVRKPVALEDDQVAVRPMLTLSLAFDHRVLDGAPAARFLGRIAELVENPLRLLGV
ncbi:MAG: 2-oxo acid dehydrogenase subunit E2 [Anaerolineae bacterium]